MQALTDFTIKGLEPSYRGKVRDVYNLGEQMLIVVTDRISAFDVVFSEGVAERGKLLTSISNHWFSLLNMVNNHLIETDAQKFPPPFADHADVLQGRSVLVKRARRIDFECVVRGYLMGSGYKEYCQSGEVCGEKLPSGLVLADKLSFPIFTPATKADSGHDQNISFAFMAEKIGNETAERLKKLSLEIFAYASEKLAERGILLADTKFEFGFLANENQKKGSEELILIDEVLTPDSSRFWKESEYQKARAEGKNPPSMDKQVLRDYLETLDWNKEPPPPTLPFEILQKTFEKYAQIEKEVLCITKQA